MAIASQTLAFISKKIHILLQPGGKIYHDLNNRTLQCSSNFIYFLKYIHLFEHLKVHGISLLFFLKKLSQRRGT